MEANLKSTLFLVSTLALAACQTQSVSLEEAKQITAKFAGQSFTPPPKNISDITAILDQQEIIDKTGFRANLARARATKPADMDTADFTQFYIDRRDARLSVGLTLDALADSRLAVKYLRQSRGIDARDRSKVEYVNASIEGSVGDISKAIKYFEKTVDEDPNYFIAVARLAELYAETGNIEGALRFKDKLEKLGIGISLRRRVTERAKASFKQRFAALNAQLAQMQGKLQEAEKFQRQAIAAEAPLREESSSRRISSEYMGQYRLAMNLIKQGRLLEAEAVAREALLNSLGTYGKAHITTAAVAAGLAKVVLAQGRFGEAKELLSRSLAMYESLGLPKSGRARGQAEYAFGRVLALTGD